MHLNLKTGQSYNLKGFSITEMVGGIKSYHFNIFKGSFSEFLNNNSDLRCRLDCSIHFYKDLAAMEDEQNEISDAKINVSINEAELLTANILFQDATHGNMASEKGLYEYALAINGYSDLFEII